jgi:hypothetical protein
VLIDYVRFQRGNRFVMEFLLKIPAVLDEPKTPKFSYLSAINYLKKA